MPLCVLMLPFLHTHTHTCGQRERKKKVARPSWPTIFACTQRTFRAWPCVIIIIFFSIVAAAVVLVGGGGGRRLICCYRLPRQRAISEWRCCFVRLSVVVSHLVSVVSVTVDKPDRWQRPWRLADSDPADICCCCGYCATWPCFENVASFHSRRLWLSRALHNPDRYSPPTHAR